MPLKANPKNLMSLIRVNASIYLSEPTAGDVPVIVKHLTHKQIHDHTIEIPYPYKKKDALAFIKKCDKRKKDFGRIMDWAIRLSNHHLIGMIGFIGEGGKSTTTTEMGFWLAKDYWDQGIMTAVLRRLSQFSFEHYQYRLITLRIFNFNEASIRVAVKSGFKKKNLLKKYYNKAGKKIDAVLYEKKNDVEAKRKRIF